MTTSSNLFADFPPVAKAEWLKKVEKDLKGRSLEELDWELEDNLRISPFATAEDIEARAPLSVGKSDNRWEIGEYVDVRDLAAANAQVREGSAGGVTAPLFRLHRKLSLTELDELLRDIDPDTLSLHFSPQHPGKDPAELFRDLIYLVRRRGLELSAIRGSMDFDPLLDWSEPPFDPLARILEFASRQTPHFRVLRVDGRTLHAGPENTVRELALIIAKGAEYLAQMEERGVPPAITNAHCQFAVAMSTSYFLEIAKLRALRVLWANVLAGHTLYEAPLPKIGAHFARETQEGDVNTNMIKASTQAMAAAVGGADLLYVLPANYARREPSTGFTRRIARNVQHLLQLESRFTEVIDPAAGSYYLENLTQTLAQAAWELFQRIEEEGGFLEFEDLA